MIVQKLIDNSLRLIGVLAAGETPAASESNDAFAALNHILSSWSTEKLSVFTVQHAQFLLTVGLRVYTMGPAGTFLTSPKPVRITAATAINGNFQRGMRVVSFDELALLSNNPSGSTETLPGLLAADNATPAINLRIFPTPNSASQLELTWWIPLTQFTALLQTIALPEGYERALKYTLAMDLAPEYGRTVPPELAALASEAKGAIVALNKSINDPMPAVPVQRPETNI